MVGHKNVTLEKVVILKIKMHVVDISADKEVFISAGMTGVIDRIR
jgi:hypothetical protein